MVSAYRLRALATSALSGILSVFPYKLVNLFFDAAHQAAHAKGPDFLTLHRRAKSGATVPWSVLTPPVPRGTTQNCALVLQGPLRHEDAFTLESVRYYTQTMPGCLLIVSTWESEPAEALDALRSLGAVVVVSKQPSVGGAMNVNRQAKSALAGIVRARELGVEWVTKSRCDQRLCNPNVMPALRDLAAAFPLEDAGSQRARLIGTSLNTSRYCPFHFSDQFMFGHIADMERYWSFPEDPRDGPVKLDNMTVRQMLEVTPEALLARSYLQRSGWACETSLAAWWRVLAERFLIIDRELPDIYWPKYFPRRERHYECYEEILGWTQMRFSDWLRLYTARGEAFAAPEHALDLAYDTKTSTVKL